MRGAGVATWPPAAQSAHLVSGAAAAHIAAAPPRLHSLLVSPLPLALFSLAAALGSSSRLTLIFRGKELPDLATCHDLGIGAGDVLACSEVTVDATGQPMPPVSYARMAASLQEARALSQAGPADVAPTAPPLTGVLVSGSVSPVTEEGEGEDATGATPSKYTRINARVVSPGAVVLAPRHPAAPSSGITVYGLEPHPQAPSGIDLERLKRERRDRQALVPTGAKDILPAEATSPGAPRHLSYMPSRVLQAIYTAKVAGMHTFHLLHRMEGRWTGEAECMYPGQRSSALGEPRVCTVNLAYDDLSGVWVTSQALTTPDGLSSTQRSVLRPVGDGRCLVEMLGDPHSGEGGSSGSPVGSDWRMTLIEQGDAVLLLTAVSPVTGRLLMVETVTLISDMARTRVVQRFSESDGSLRCTYIVREERVLDAVTGAVMSGPPARARAGSHGSHGSASQHHHHHHHPAPAAAVAAAVASAGHGPGAATHHQEHGGAATPVRGSPGPRSGGSGGVSTGESSAASASSGGGGAASAAMSP